MTGGRPRYSAFNETLGKVAASLSLPLTSIFDFISTALLLRDKISMRKYPYLVSFSCVYFEGRVVKVQKNFGYSKPILKDSLALTR